MIKLVYRLSFIVYRLWKSQESDMRYTKNRLGVTINQSGQILVLVFIALGVVLFTVLFIISGAQLYFQNALRAGDLEKALALAEAGVDKAVTSLNKNPNYAGEQETIIGEGSYSVVLTTKDAAAKIIEATGYIPDKINPKAKRTIRIEAAKGVGISFLYGVQVGEGGLKMGQNSRINGSVYSNGSINMDNNTLITGDAWVAEGVQGTPDQQSDCSGAECSDFIFGKVVSDERRFDVAANFRLSSDYTVSKVAVKIKKNGSPPDLTVRILGNKSTEGQNNRPDKNQVLATGTLYAGLVTSSYGFAEVTFANSPALRANTYYWLTIDTNPGYWYNGPNYWFWSKGLSGGGAKWAHDWSLSNPPWRSVSGGGLHFKVFVGGVIGLIEGSSGARIGGDAHANTLKNLTVTGGAYYKAISNVTAGSYYPGSSDPPPKVMPISEANIAEWKSQAEAAGVFSGDITDCPSSALAAGKYIGSINIDRDKNCTITIESPVWITGSLSLDNRNTIKLDPGYGASSGVIVVDGTIELDNRNKAQGSGTEGSVLVLLSNYDSAVDDKAAIHLKNNGNSGVLYAGKGKIEVGNDNSIKEATGWKIKLKENTVVDYESGLAGLFFTGPGGTYSLVKGTYQVR